jgi:hypothetical protein
MKKVCLGLALTLCIAVFAQGQSDSNIHALRPFNPDAQPPQTGTISYNGGPVFETAPTVYIVWYGKWTKKDKSIIDGYFTNLGGSTMNKINTRYSDGANKFIPNKVNHATTNDYQDNYSLGKNLTGGDGAIHTIVRNAIKKKKLPADKNGIYFVLTATDVTFPGMCTQLCGYHSPATDIVSGDVIKYSMVGNPAQCPRNCEASAVVGDSGSPNNDPGADGTVNIMWHEFSESASDPEVNLQTAWAGQCGENGDCCAWFFGTLKTDNNGHKYTNTIKGKNYIAQTMLELNTKARGQNEPGTCKNTY